jgi:SWI/SNF-related matrix-associated actin-dependent regulator of chromatin subfamily A-like protein 1
MKIHHEPTTPPTFYAVADYKDKDTLKAARFRWHPDHRRWWTQDPNAAQRLAAYADAPTAALLNRPAPPQIAAVDAVAASRATAPLAPLAIPTPPGRVLMPFQAAGVARLEQINQTGLRGAILADEMGLGKTPSACAILNLHPEYDSILILCPASLRLNWRNELAAWSTTPRTVGIAETTHAPTTQIVIAHYDIFSRNCPARAALQARKWSLMICDEAHYLKNPDANRSAQILGRKATKRTAAMAGIDAARVLFLTGTPATSRPVELFGLLHAADPAAWPSWYSYAVRYCAGHKTRFGFDATGSSNAQELNARLRSTVMVRRLKSDPGIMDDLPAKRDQLIPLPANGAAKILAAERPYLAKIQALSANLDSIDPATNAAEYAAAVRALNSQLADFEEISRIRKELEIAKAEAVIQYARDIFENGEQKLVIFGHHIEALETVTAGLSDYGAEVAHGGTSTDERQRLVQLFQDPASPCRVLVCSLTAMGVGHTMTQAAHVLHMAMSWLPSDMSQATDRLHRIGQKRQVTAHYLMYDDSLEIYIARTVLKKIKILNATLDADTGTAAADYQADAAAHESAIRAQIAALAAAAAAQPEPAPAAPQPADAQTAAETTPATITPARIAAITAALRHMSGDDQDHASTVNGIGFNKFDGRFGHTLATQTYPLTQRQAAAALKMLQKYRGQLGAMLDACQ